MKSIVLYSSYFGNTKLLADQIAETTGSEIQGIVHGRHFRCFLHMIGIRGGPYPILDLSEYDLIYAGGPIWMGTAAPGFNRLLKNLDVSGKQIKFFFRAGGGDFSRLDKKLIKKAAELKFELVQTVVVNGDDSTEVSDEKLKALIEGREPVIDVEPETPSGADDETQIREFVEKYIEVLTTGNTKFVEKNVDLKAMYVKDGEIYGEYGLSKKNTQEEYADLFNTQTLPLMRKCWDKTFEFESFELKGDEAHIKIKAEGAKRQDQPLILKKVSGKWKLIWIPMWGGF